MATNGIVIDTNIFVAAGFKPGSSSGRIVNLVRDGVFRLVWSEGTRREIEHTVGRIPVLSDRILENLFGEEGRREEKLNEAGFAYIADPADRKFAALAVAAEVPLITNDDHLLVWAERLPVAVLKPGDFLRSRF